jgi:hypothetical protein
MDIKKIYSYLGVMGLSASMLGPVDSSAFKVDSSSMLAVEHFNENIANWPRENLCPFGKGIDFIELDKDNSRSFGSKEVIDNFGVFKGLRLMGESFDRVKYEMPFFVDENNVTRDGFAAWRDVFANLSPNSQPFFVTRINNDEEYYIYPKLTDRLIRITDKDYGVVLKEGSVRPLAKMSQNVQNSFHNLIPKTNGSVRYFPITEKLIMELANFCMCNSTDGDVAAAIRGKFDNNEGSLLRAKELITGSINDIISKLDTIVTEKVSDGDKEEAFREKQLEKIHLLFSDLSYNMFNGARLTAIRNGFSNFIDTYRSCVKADSNDLSSFGKLIRKECPDSIYNIVASQEGKLVKGIGKDCLFCLNRIVGGWLIAKNIGFNSACGKGKVKSIDSYFSGKLDNFSGCDGYLGDLGNVILNATLSIKNIDAVKCIAGVNLIATGGVILANNLATLDGNAVSYGVGPESSGFMGIFGSYGLLEESADDNGGGFVLSGTCPHTELLKESDIPAGCGIGGSSGVLSIEHPFKPNSVINPIDFSCGHGVDGFKSNNFSTKVSDGGKSDPIKPIKMARSTVAGFLAHPDNAAVCEFIDAISSAISSSYQDLLTIGDSIYVAKFIIEDLCFLNWSIKNFFDVYLVDKKSDDVIKDHDKKISGRLETYAVNDLVLCYALVKRCVDGIDSSGYADLKPLVVDIKKICFGSSMSIINGAIEDFEKNMKSVPNVDERKKGLSRNFGSMLIKKEIACVLAKAINLRDSAEKQQAGKSADWKNKLNSLIGGLAVMEVLESIIEKDEIVSDIVKNIPDRIDYSTPPSGDKKEHSPEDSGKFFDKNMIDLRKKIGDASLDKNIRIKAIEDLRTAINNRIKNIVDELKDPKLSDDAKKSLQDEKSALESELTRIKGIEDSIKVSTGQPGNTNPITTNSTTQPLGSSPLGTLPATSPVTISAGNGSQIKSTVNIGSSRRTRRGRRGVTWRRGRRSNKLRNSNARSRKRNKKSSRRSSRKSSRNRARAKGKQKK